MPSALRLTLPIPPSVNSSYANVTGRGRIATKALRDWKRDAGWRLKLQERKQFAGPFRIAIYLPEAMRGDIDNRTKGILDLLVEHRVTPDDRFAKFVSAERSELVAANECLIVVEAA